MNATNRLLALWWAKMAPASAVEAGKRLGVSGQAIANYRAELSQATPAVIAKMAGDLGENPAQWLAQVEAERARNDGDRKAWAAVARKLGAAAAVAGIAIMFGAFGHDKNAIFALFLALPFHAEPLTAVCIMRSLRGRGQRARRQPGP